jgi:hypothetical protein
MQAGTAGRTAKCLFDKALYNYCCFLSRVVYS